MDVNVLSRELKRHPKTKVSSGVHTGEDIEALLKKRKQFEYGKKETWDERYVSESEEYEWLCKWDTELRNAIDLQPGSRILHMGCGTSALGVDMAKEHTVKNADYSEAAILFMQKKYPDHDWSLADGTSMPQFSENEFDAVVEKGTLDALACAGKERDTLCQALISECSRVAKSKVVCISFGQPETRLNLLPPDTTVQELVIPPRADKVYVYTFRPASSHTATKNRVYIASPLLLIAIFLVFMLLSWKPASGNRKRQDLVNFLKENQNESDAVLTSYLEPRRGTARCNFQLLREFTHIANGLNWTLGAGTLLGALRSNPPGLLPWEHDVDVYIDGPSAFRLLDRVAGHGDDGLLQFRGFFDSTRQRPCCGFGWKFFHRDSTACELDVLVLSLSKYAPLVHGETRLWPIWAPALAMMYDAWSYQADPTFLIIPEDIDRKTLCVDREKRWNIENTSFIGGPSLSFFQNEYFRWDEFYPVRLFRMYNMTVQLPQDPWSSLYRTYGKNCRRFARLDTFGHVELDLNDPTFSRLRRPADISA